MRKLLKNTVRRLFRACGFEMTRNWAAHRTSMGQVLRNAAQNGLNPKSVIDVGVGAGTEDLYRTFPQSRFLLVEPLIERRPILEDLTRRLNAEYVLACAGPAPGSATLNVHPSHLEGSSTHKETEGTHADGFEREVPVVTLDQECNQRNLPGPYLLKIDAQGAELAVLAGAGRSLESTEMVILEVQFFEFLRGAPQFADIVGYMNERGFAAYDCFGSAYRPLDGALASMDVVFVREDGHLRQSHSFATADQRRAMGKIFLSPGRAD